MSGVGHLVEQEVFTAEQAADILGIKRESVMDLLARSREHGQPVSWARDDPDNPVNNTLVLAAWVLMQAASRNGVLAERSALKIQLPVLSGAVAGAVRLPSDWNTRLAESEMLASGYRAELDDERRLRLEESAASARVQAEERVGRLESDLATSRADAAKWRAKYRSVVAVLELDAAAESERVEDLVSSQAR